MDHLPGDSTTDAAGATPVMAQFFAAKAEAPGALVFFRMGDFYELFFEDAARAAEAIGIALTHRGNHAGKPIPMAGVPAHAAEAYLAKLIRAGFQVAVCEQMEDPAAARRRGAKAVVRREVVRVVTPGTLTEEGLLDARGANRLAAIAVRAGVAAAASLELSTGEVECQTTSPSGLAAVLGAIQPSEILVPDRLFADREIAAALDAVTQSRPGCVIQPMASALAEPAAAEARLKRLYAVVTLDGLGAFGGAEIAALGLLGAHIETTQGGRAPVLQPPRRLEDGEVMTIDPATRASLEIERTLGGAREGSLLAAIDRTVTGPGARRLAAWLARPLTDPAKIEARLDAVGWLAERTRPREDLRARLKGAPDMARALSRLSLGRGGPRDLEAVVEGLAAATDLARRLAEEEEPLMAAPELIVEARRAFDPAARPILADLAGRLTAGLADEVPLLARDGGFVADGVSAALDEARALRDGSRKVVASLEARFAAESGVALRIRHNAVLGYFLETTARQAEPLFAPPLSAQFIHRQTLASQVRFTTVELSELDARIARAADQALALELAVFEDWRAAAVAAGPEILAAAEGLARLDVVAGLAEWAVETGGVRPSLDRSLVFEARGARHPVVEAAVRRSGGAFTPNDCALDGAGESHARLSLVTGPNMAGKSTFLRQNALLAILAQAGAFVPARSLTLGVVDRLFSRVGAGDDLARGRSTFMAEMVETAAILTQATPRSLVILDEIGRGTATWDGLAIAWACAEALHDTNRCRALFATHYHELAVLEERLAHVSNLSLKAKEWNGELIFLHEAGPGCADRSYGVQVAKLAGVPAGVVARAREVLARLETENASHASLADLPLFATAAPNAPAPPQPSAIERDLRDLDLDGMSPREAMEALYRLKGMV
jgi:DNA mismatch repair protein MutS